MELYEMTAAQLSEKLESKEISSCELTQAVIDRINSVDGKVKAYLTVNAEEAIEQAKAVDAKRMSGEKLPKLAGIPIGIKDNISTKGIKTTCASKMLENYVPPFDATVIEKIKANGMVLLGKLNMDEFAMGSSTENSYFNVTHNPFDLDKVPGGSSGGSAAAVSAREAIVALGSDTGGSIRQPSANCGVVGLKPTYGSVSRYGLVAFASSLDQIGPIGKSVKDVAMVQDIICGRDKMDATSAVREYASIADSLTGDVSGIKIGIPKEYFGEAIDDDVKAAVMNAVHELEKAGARVCEISLPSAKYALPAYYIISSAEASSNLARFDGVRYGYRAKDYTDLVDMYEKTRSEGFGSEVKRRIMLGTFVLSSGYYDAYYKQAKLMQRKIAGEYKAAFNEVDVIATPTAPFTACKIGQNIDDPLKMYACDICTVTVNIAGLPAVSLPCGMDRSNMPVGLQLIGDSFCEDKILGAAYAYEKLVGGFAAPAL